VRGGSFGILAVVAVLTLVALGGRSFLGRAEAPDMAQIAKLAKQPMTTAPGPALAARVDGVGFPDWSRWGWKAVGGRSDRFPKRRTEAVLYAKGKERIAVVIVGGTANVDSLQPTIAIQRTPPSGKVELQMGGTSLRIDGKIAGPAESPDYLCGEPKACDLSPAHVSVKRRVDGHPVALIGWPTSAALAEEIQDMAVRGFAAP
jgi:hypothetical protein